MRISKKILAIALSILMAVSMMPFTVFADDPYASLKNTTTVVHFDSKDWYLIDYDSTTVTLLSKECVGKSVFGTNNTYSGSTLETYVNNWYSENITADAKTAVADNKAFILESLTGINTDVLKCNQVEGTIYNLWWLCSKDHSEDRAMCVDGQVGYLDSLPVNWESGVRPALQLDLSKVEFNSETKTFALPTLAPVSYKNAAYNSATNTVTYTDATCDDYTVVAADTTTFEDGKWYVVNSNVTVNGRITVNGAANLILADGYTLTVTEGVAVTNPNSLTIYGQENGTGTLTATSTSYNAAGIGGNDGENGPITINGGTVNATSGGAGAGIGGGEMGNGGPVIINGGTVTAIGGEDDGAGIGSGGNGSSCNVTINGGTVNATGRHTYDNTAGIGNSGWSSNGGNITINGGTVNAACAAGSQGIGGSGCTISITGGTVDVNRGVTDASYGLFGSSFTMSGGEVYVNRFVYVNTTITGGTLIAEANPPFQSDVSIGTGLKVLAGANEESAVEVEPSAINMSSDVYWNSKWIKIYPAPVLPTATVTEITAPGLEKAYSFKADDTEETIATSAYKNYIADFAISFDTDVCAGDITLGGAYDAHNNGEWVYFTLADALGVDANATVPQGTQIRLLATALTNLGYETGFTYEDIVTVVKEFKCGIKGPGAAGAEATVDLNLYASVWDDEKQAYVEALGGEVVNVAEEEYVLSNLPSVTVTEISAPGLEQAYSFKADDTAETIATNAYKNYIADFAVSFNEDVCAGDITLGGAYQSYKDGEWVYFTLAEGLGVDDDYVIPAGTEIRLLDQALKNLGYDSEFTVEDIVTVVKELKCGAKGPGAAGTKMSVDLNLYESIWDEDKQAYVEREGSEPTVVAEEEYIFSELPSVTVTELNLPDYDVAYSFKADDTAETIATNAYKNYIADFAITLDDDVLAGDITLGGQYDAYSVDWVEFTLAEALGLDDDDIIPAGTEIRLLETALKNLGYETGFTYEDIVNTVKEFHCGARGMNASGVKLSVDLNLYESIWDEDKQAYVEREGCEPTLVAEEEYVFSDDLFSITVSDAIDMNIYAAASADIAEIKITYNATPEKEEYNPETKSYKGAALAALVNNGKYVLSVSLAPAQIRDEITVEFFKADGTKARADIVTTIADYCTQIIAGSYDQKLKDLAMATLDYGKAAYEYFGYDTPGAMLFDDQSYYFEDAQMNDYDRGSITGTDFGINAVSYVATSVPALRFYVSGIDEATAASLEVSSNIGNASFAKLGDSLIILQVTDIPAVLLGEEITITAGDVTIKYTPMRWVQLATFSNSATLSKLGAAIANYYSAAYNYFATENDGNQP